MTHASQYAIEAILSQCVISADRPIANASRTLNKAEINYSVIQKELLAILWAIKYFRLYLYRQKIRIITNHRPLTYIFNIKNPSSQLMRWQWQLEENDYVIVYRAGSLHANADCLSCIYLITDYEYASFLKATEKPILTVRSTMVQNINNQNWNRCCMVVRKITHYFHNIFCIFLISLIENKLLLCYNHMLVVFIILS